MAAYDLDHKYDHDDYVLHHAYSPIMVLELESGAILL